MSNTTEQPQPAIEHSTPRLTHSQRFQRQVEQQFEAQMGAGRAFTEQERRLIQHLFLSVDQALKAWEAKRTEKYDDDQLAGAADEAKAYTWHHVDRQKLALDAVHRITLGLDALVKNHLWPVAYWSNRKGLYDIDLRIGYLGWDYIVRRYALEPPLSIDYQLVYETDRFTYLPRSSVRDVEGFDFAVTEPFGDRGKVVGGFGHITYDDPRKNRVVLVNQRDFNRSRAAGGEKFWKDHEIEMRLKTVVHRTTQRIALDPGKVHAAALAAVLADETTHDEDPIDVEVRTNGNRTPVDLPAQPTAEPVAFTPTAQQPSDAGLTEEDKAEALRREAAEGELFERQQVQARRGPGY